MRRVLRLQGSWSHLADESGRTLLVSRVLGRRIHIAVGYESFSPALRALGLGLPEQNAAQRVSRLSGITLIKAQELIDQLVRTDVLVRRPSTERESPSDSEGRYDRQVRYFKYFESSEATALGMNRRLQDSTVLVAGLGGLGGWIALLLARLGIRRLIGVDHDRVELSNLHRQILYGNKHLGMPKVDACAEALSQADPEVEFTGWRMYISRPQDLESRLGGVDLVINPFPYIPTFRRVAAAVAEACLAAGVACLHQPLPGCVGPLTIRGETPCARCAMDVLGPRLDPDDRVWEGQPYLAALAPRQAVSGGLAVWEATRFLSAMDTAPTLGGVFFIDLTSYDSTQFIRIDRDPACASCGRGRRGRSVELDSSAGR